MSSLRQLQAGSTYQPPPVTTGIPPDSCCSMEVRAQHPCCTTMGACFM